MVRGQRTVGEQWASVIPKEPTTEQGSRFDTNHRRMGETSTMITLVLPRFRVSVAVLPYKQMGSPLIFSF